jgi:hypothetical protein
MEFTSAQRRHIAMQFQQKFNDQPLIKKLGGNTHALLLEACRFQFEQLPIESKTFPKKVDNGNGEPKHEVFYRFTYEWKHPCTNFSVKIDIDMQKEGFDKVV